MLWQLYNTTERKLKGSIMALSQSEPALYYIYLINYIILVIEIYNCSISSDVHVSNSVFVFVLLSESFKVHSLTEWRIRVMRKVSRLTL
jgi:hypothetical protein